jgi:ParB-like chromosome segregation protein Spo0J
MTNNGNSQPAFEDILLKNPPPLRIKHAKVPTDLIDFDLENPRLKYQMDLNPHATPEELIFKLDDTKKLKKNIKENGLIDPIYVMPKGERYLVIEGNRRTACIKDLNKEHPNGGFATISARVLPENADTKKIALLMASFHVAGKLKWDAHEKAGHVYHMLHIMRIDKAELATILHMGQPSIVRTAESFRILEEVYKRIDNGKYAKDADGKWSFFDELLKQKELRNKLNKTPAWADDFCRWVGDMRLPKAENVRDLADILNRNHSREAFEQREPKEAFEVALELSKKANPAKSSEFFKKVEALKKAIKLAQFGDQAAARENENAADMLLETHQELGEFIERSGIRRATQIKRAV